MDLKLQWWTHTMWVISQTTHIFIEWRDLRIIFSWEMDSKELYQDRWPKSKSKFSNGHWLVKGETLGW